MKWVMRLLPLLLIGLLLGSCDRSPTSNPTTAGNNVSTPTTITVTLTNSPVREFRNTDVTVNINAYVTDNRGLAVAGAPVAFSLQKRASTQAVVSYPNGTDTTNSNGFVGAQMALRVDTTETIVISARLANNSQVSTSVQCPVTLATDQIQQFQIELQPNILTIRQDHTDSATLTARVTDITGGGISGLRINFRVDSTLYARLSATSGVTDVAGEASVKVLSLLNQYSDSVRISASIQGMTASSPNASRVIYLKVRPLTRATDIWMQWVNPTDTLLTATGSTPISRQFMVWATDADHVRLPNVPVRLACAGIGSVPSYTATSANANFDTLTWSSDGMIGDATINVSLINQTMMSSQKPTGPIAMIGGDLSKQGKSMPAMMNPSFEGTTLLGLDEFDANAASIRIHVINPVSQPTLTVNRVNPIDSTMIATGHDSLEIIIRLRDQNLVGIANAVIQLSTAYGSVDGSVTTGLDGTVRTWVRDGGSITPPEGTTLGAYYPIGNIRANMWFRIDPMLSLGSIQLVGPRSHYAYPADTVSFRANVFLSNGQPAYDSTVVEWSTFTRTGENGYGHWQLLQTKTGVGFASNTYVMGQGGIGFDSLVVTAGSVGNRVTNSVLLERLPGPATRLLLGPANQTLPVNGPSRTMWAIVYDTVGNIVPNPTLTWGCNLGSIAPAGFSNDTSYAMLSPGANAGQGRYWVTTNNGATDTLGYAIFAATPRTLTLAADSLSIQVRGTGGYEHTYLRAMVRDANGNAVTNGIPVFFQVLNTTSFGTNATYSPYFSNPGRDTITTFTGVNGEAIATLSAGYRSGPIQLLAVVLNPDGSMTQIAAQLSNVQVVAGPPAVIDVSVNRENATQEGGGIWSMWMNARIVDRFTNPVSSNIAVTFEASPDTLATVGIGGSSTGNLGPSNQRVPGTAFTRCTYQGARTFDTVTVRARCLSTDSTGARITVSGQYTFALPLQSGVMQLNVSPSTWNFTTSGGVARHMVWCVVRDGYGTPVHGAPVLFSVQRGRIFKTMTEIVGNPPVTPALTYNPTLQTNGTQLLPGTNPAVYWPVNKRKTGNYTVSWMPALSYNDVNGFGSATVYIGGTGSGEIFLDPQTLEITSEVTCIIEGYPNIQSVRSVINYQRSQ